MENLIMFLATSLALHVPTPKFKRYTIGSSGCSSLLFSGANSLYVKYTKDDEKVYFNEHTIAGVTYGLVVVQMKDVFTLEEASTILVQYTKAVRKPFKIVHHLPMEMEKQNGKVSLAGYWQDQKGGDWKVKGYTNGKTIAVLYVKNIGASNVKDDDNFLNGLKFSLFS